jgi:hypothetical protein
MSVQDVQLFFWGQNRFASVVPLLASPIADPLVNLFLVLLINSLSFHLLLLILSWMGARVVAENRTWTTTLVLFLVMAATAHAVLAPDKLHVLALEAQPYSMSLGLTLGAFLLWKQPQWWQFGLAAVMVGIASGLNPSTVLIAAFLAVVEMMRRRQWVRWPLFGVAWVIWFGVWVKLAEWYPGNTGAMPEVDQDYFGFAVDQFVGAAPQSLASIAGAIRPIRFVVVVAIACMSILLLSRARRAVMLPRLFLAILFCTLYWAVFTGNSWVAANLFAVRYFAPVVLLVIVILAAPTAGALLALPLPRRAESTRAVAVGVAGLACAAALFGPFVTPAQAWELQAGKESADYVEANDITFLAGYYWALLPIELQALENGRHAVFFTSIKSDGDPAQYAAALDRELAESDGPPRAMCVNDDVSACLIYLEYWTRPGWQQIPGECPAPDISARHGAPPVPGCKLLEFNPG